MRDIEECEIKIKIQIKSTIFLIEPNFQFLLESFLINCLNIRIYIRKKMSDIEECKIKIKIQIKSTIFLIELNFQFLWESFLINCLYPDI